MIGTIQQEVDFVAFEAETNKSLFHYLPIKHMQDLQNGTMCETCEVKKTSKSCRAK